MHTQNLTPGTHAKRHRWMIAAPLFALCVLVSAWSGRPQHQASVIPEIDYIIDGRGITQSGSDLVLQGSALLATRTLVSIQAGASRVSVWNGVADLSYDGTSLGVASLTAPSLVRKGSGTWLIPIGMQMTFRDSTESDLLPLPSHYLQDAVQKAAELSASLTPLRPALRDLQPLSSDLQTLLTVHPLLRDETWVLTDVRALEALRLLPAADHEHEAVSPLAITHWGRAWTAYLESRDDPSAVIQESLPQLTADIRRLQTAGYPERARNHAQALGSAFGWYRDVLDASANDMLDELADIAAGHAPAPLPARPAQREAEVVAETVPPSPERAAELQQIVQSVLQANGAMLTAQTSVMAVDAARVTVKNIVIGTPKGDQAISFTYNPDADEVSDIVKDGRMLPNAMPLQGYLEWVRAQ